MSGSGRNSPSTADDPEAFKSYFRPHSEVLSDISEAPETELRQTLKERHVNMIGFSTVLGVGLFLSAGKAIFLAGPGGAVLAYLVTGTIVWSVMACMGEMTALFPVKGPVFEFPRRFIDESVGLATGWIIWFSWVTIAAAEILAITNIFQFKFDPAYLAEVGYPRATLEWPAGLTTNPGIWVGIFLLIILLINLLPVRQYGRLEYIFGCSKIIVLVMLILFNVIVNARHLYTSDRFWTYETPYGFSAQNMTITPATNNDPGLTYTGTLGQFTSFFSAMCTTIFSILGWEVILFTAPENADLKRTETMKISSRKIALRVIMLYALATFTVGLNVPYTDENLVNLTINGIGGGEGSAFIISAVRNHVLYLPHLLNAFYIFSACSTGTNALYSASRTLHALASIPDAWPRWGPVEAVRSRLERTIFGVPMAAVFLSWLVGFVAFLSTSTVESATLGRIADFTVVGTLIVYSMNCAAYLQFYRAINDAAEGKLDEDLNLTPEMRNLYKRTAKRYPYRSHLQWLRAVYGLTGCTIIAIFQGWRTFEPPFAVKDFIAAYIAFVLFAILSFIYFIKSRGFLPRNWRVRANMLFGLESVGPIAVDSEKLTLPCDFCGAKHRRGHLVFPDNSLVTSGNMRALVEWIWVWMK